jgi:sugar phosphate isomerase/epimerase
MSQPVLRHIANLWTLLLHPSEKNEWSLEQKLIAIKAAGFDGVCWAGSAELRAGCERQGLIFVGGMASGTVADFPRLLREQQDGGAHHVNVQLAADDVLTPEALELALVLNREGKRLGLEPAFETHRGTCTETPEKTYALADAYQKQTGELLPLSWDFSHFAVVKHLVPENLARRLAGARLCRRPAAACGYFRDARIVQTRRSGKAAAADSAARNTAALQRSKNCSRNPPCFRYLF